VFYGIFTKVYEDALTPCRVLAPRHEKGCFRNGVLDEPQGQNGLSTSQHAG